MTEVPRKPITVPDILARKRDGVPVVMVTSYDATMTRLIDACDVDIVLVGDSLGMVVQGHPHTLEVDVEHIVYHTRCVRRALRHAHLCADMPFMSYQVSPEQALTNAGRLIREGGAASVKIEGGESVAPAIAKIIAAGIPVMGHLGLTPQSVHAFGGFKIQARDAVAADELRREAKLLEQIGCYAIVLEGIPAALAREVSESLSIPTIGIGAGVGCDGQVLVIHDLLGLDDGFQPKFVKRFAELAAPIRAAVSDYAREVRAHEFPGDEHSFGTGRTPIPAGPSEVVPSEPGEPRRRVGYGPG
jgi:3-methyl-2-oxobutanoate hydroxymethyltransferase